MEEILHSTCILAQDQYGNYVVQVPSNISSLQIIVPLQSPDKGMFWVFAIRALVRIPARHQSLPEPCSFVGCCLTIR
jgi:hypothetical protein